MNELISRRQALLSVAATASLGARSHASRVESKQPICVFTKPFNSLAFSELADRIAELGFDGIEAPIRAGGHIEPQDAEQRLPELVEALASRDLELTLMTTDINDADDPLTQKVLRTAASLGVHRYRMKYLKYDLKRPVSDQLEEWRPKFEKLAELNRELGVLGLYQNHASDNLLGSTLWDLQQVLAGISPEYIAVAYDIRHATVEGGTSWPITFHMIRPHIDTVYVKDFVWSQEKVHNVPLGEGQVNPSFFRMLAESKFEGPISLHEEYLDHRQPSLVPQHLDAIHKDLVTLKKWLNA